jgi:non-reducing end alpha-L-arabinofuranosidase
LPDFFSPPWSWRPEQEGAIVLGTAGDNTNAGQGSFFEGVMTAHYASDAADAAVQANIVAAGYGK